jgi:hypothetical protein
METTVTTQSNKSNTRKTPRVGNTSSKRRVLKAEVVKKSTSKKPNALKATKSTRISQKKEVSQITSKALSTTQLTKRVAELEVTVKKLINVLNNEFRSEMLQGPRGVSRSLSKAGLLKDS